MHAFLTTELTLGEARPELEESIEVVSVPVHDVRTIIREGGLQNTKSIASLLMILDRLEVWV